MHRVAIIVRKLCTGALLTGSTLRATAIPFVLTLLLAVLISPQTKADVGVVLNESMVTSMDRITGTGHSAVYFSRICPDSPIRLRLCGPGEHGSVMSNYINIGEDHAYEWNIVPLNIYLYGVEDSRNRPLFGSFKVKHALEERYRDNYLSDLCASDACINSSKSEWREMVAATFVRSLNMFIIETTEEQDRQFIAEFNDSLNENHFNGVTNNCADFTRRVINTYFPNATRPDYLNDFGMTSPKAIAHSFTRYAKRHPELNLRVMHFAQAPGTVKRSSEVRAGTEQLYHSKKFLVPMIFFADHVLAVAAGSYLLTGRFNPNHEFEHHPAEENISAHAGNRDLVSAEERTRIVGTAKEWKQYRKTFDSMVAEDTHNDVFDGRKDLGRFFKQLDAAGTASVDQQGLIWIEAPLGEAGETVKVGASASNILAPGSDEQLAHQLLLTRVDHVLKGPQHSRETMSEFVQDWAALQNASEKHSVALARNTPPKKTLDGASLPAAGKDGIQSARANNLHH